MGMHTTNRKPDIVFVVLDTHRLDRLGCYGYHRASLTLCKQILGKRKLTELLPWLDRLLTNTCYITNGTTEVGDTGGAETLCGG